MSGMSAQPGIWKDVTPFLPRFALEDAGVPYDLPDIPLHLFLGISRCESDDVSSGSSHSTGGQDDDHFPSYEGDLLDSMLESCFNSNDVFQTTQDQNSDNEAEVPLFSSPRKSSVCLSGPDNSSSPGIEIHRLRTVDEVMRGDIFGDPFGASGNKREQGTLRTSPRRTTLNSSHAPGRDNLSLRAVAGRSREKFGKRKSKRAPARAWSEAEHQLFEEALELFGRDWGACARHIGTRPAPLVRSHAQKYLIKLWKLGKPLPVKVAESGNGYTLSGKPLLPESASARSYLTKIPCPRSDEGKRK